MIGYNLPRGVVKACAGIVEGAADTEPYASYIKQAEQVIGHTYGEDEAAQRERVRLIEAVKLNLINRYSYPFETLARQYNLPVSLRTFQRDKRRFCFCLASLCGFTSGKDGT
jgi:hypothetical protein